MSKETRSTASVTRSPWRKATERLRTERRGAEVNGPSLSPERLPRVEGVAHGLADEDQQRQHAGDREEAGDAEPGRLDVCLGLLEQFAERGRPGRQAEAEEIE